MSLGRARAPAGRTERAQLSQPAAGMPEGAPVLELVAEVIAKYALTPVAFLPCVFAIYGLRGGALAQTAPRDS